MKIQEKNSIRDGGSTAQKMLTLLYSLLTLTLCMNTLFYFGCFENRNRLLRISIVLLCFPSFSHLVSRVDEDLFVQQKRFEKYSYIDMTESKVFAKLETKDLHFIWEVIKNVREGSHQCCCWCTRHFEVCSSSHNINSFSNEHFYESVFETLALGDLGFPCLGQSWEIES